MVKILGCVHSCLLTHAILNHIWEIENGIKRFPRYVLTFSAYIAKVKGLCDTKNTKTCDNSNLLSLLIEVIYPEDK